ncbi:MAG: hypothetical protein IJX93_11300 [Clostridia bacterium]|nr:hypothetical protein [Clostridia bacterium]
MNTKLYSFENFDIDVNGSSMYVIVWGLYIGIMIGVLGALITRVYSARLISALVKCGATDAEHAVTLDSLDIKGKSMIRHMLKPGSVLYRTVECANREEFPEQKHSGLKKFWHEKFLSEEVPEKIPFELAKFYLPEERRISAELRFAVEEHPVRNFIFAAVGLFAVACFAVFAIPELLTMFDNFVTQVKPESNIL